MVNRCPTNWSWSLDPKKVIYCHMEKHVEHQRQKLVSMRWFPLQLGQQVLDTKLFWLLMAVHQAAISHQLYYFCKTAAVSSKSKSLQNISQVPSGKMSTSHDVKTCQDELCWSPCIFSCQSVFAPSQAPMQPSPFLGPTVLKSSCSEFNCEWFTPHTMPTSGGSVLSPIGRLTVVLNMVMGGLNWGSCWNTLSAPPPNPPYKRTHTSRHSNDPRLRFISISNTSSLSHANLNFIANERTMSSSAYFNEEEDFIALP